MELVNPVKDHSFSKALACEILPNVHLIVRKTKVLIYVCVLWPSIILLFLLISQILFELCKPRINSKIGILLDMQ
jgi:hypothetical protein